MPAEVAWGAGRSTVAQVFAARKATQLSAPQLVRHDGGVPQRPRSKRQVELLLHEIHVPIGEDEFQPHLRMPRETFGDGFAEQRLRERHRRRHSQSPGGVLGPPCHCAPGLHDRLERRTTRTEVSLARARKLHVARRAVKKACAERALELGDPATHRCVPYLPSTARSTGRWGRAPTLAR